MKTLHVLRVGDCRVDPSVVALADAADAPPLDATSDNLLLRVLAGAFNAGDAKFMSGAMPLARGAKSLPYTPGLEVCGVVEAVGVKAAAAGAFKIGDRVVAALRPMQPTGGGLAQYVVVEAALAAVVPPSVSDVEAAALPLAGVLACKAIKDAGVGKDSRVLVLGACSAVGAMVVQLARHAGAAFVAGTTPDAARVAALPLSLTIVDDNKHDKWYDVLHDKRVDVVVDCVGEPNGWRHAEKVLVPSRRATYAVLLSELVSDGDVKAVTQLLALGFVGMWKSFWRAGPQLKVVGEFPSAATLAEVVALAAAGHLKAPMDAETPLALTTDALQHAAAATMGRQTSGKLVFQIDH